MIIKFDRKRDITDKDEKIRRRKTFVVPLAYLHFHKHAVFNALFESSLHEVRLDGNLK
jgi:hypothetical protein